MRILVTGSRDWDQRLRLYNVLNEMCDEAFSVIVHGACPTGADQMADDWANAQPDITVERHPAQWGKFGKGAGFKRNAEMVNLGADLCLAFIKDGSKGATHTANLAERAGITTRRYIA